MDEALYRPVHESEFNQILIIGLFKEPDPDHQKMSKIQWKMVKG